jgi:predicted RND superfamily exporter protein
MVLVSALTQAPSYWSVTVADDGAHGEKHRARISVDRGWLDDHTQGPYVERVQAQLAALQSEYSSSGYQIEMEGGLLLADLFINRLRDTQRASFVSAFLVVALTLTLLLRSDVVLLGWAVAANLLPVLGLLGLMGWAGIGIDPANTMVGALLLVIAVDDTIHISLRYLRERRSGADVIAALRRSYSSVGEAVVVSTVCLAVGFSVLIFSQWGGLMWFGMLASLGVVLALMADLLLLPAGLVAAARLSSETRAGAHDAVG